MPPERKLSTPTCPEYTENPYKKTENSLTNTMNQIKKIKNKDQQKKL